jgi:hypothetical protein
LYPVIAISFPRSVILSNPKSTTLDLSFSSLEQEKKRIRNKAVMINFTLIKIFYELLSVVPCKEVIQLQSKEMKN